jgi:DNA-binding XRE family transcriptional regulator
MGGKELIDKVCNELNIKQKELAELIGANSGTVKNWKVKNEVPDWAEKSINLLIKNHKKDQIILNFEEVVSFLGAKHKDIIENR